MRRHSISRSVIKLVFTLCLLQFNTLSSQESDGSTIEILSHNGAVYDYASEQKKITLNGPVTIQSNTLKIKCDLAEILSSRKDAKSTDSQNKLGSIDQILATGNVEIHQAGSVAYAGRAEIIPALRKLILEDNPRIVDAYGTISGHRIVYLQGERNIRIESGEDGNRSRIQLNNVQDVDFLMGDEPETPPAPKSE